MECWNIGFMGFDHYSSIPSKLGRFTQIGLDDLGVILDDLRRTFCDPLSEI
jgi:hypothetical protein